MAIELDILKPFSDYISGPDPYEESPKPGQDHIKERKHLQYPISNDHLYRGRVVFSTTKLDETNIETSADVVGQEKTQGQDTSVESVELSKQQKLAFEGKTNTSKLGGPLPDGAGGTRCSLYLPSALSFTDGAHYENTDLGLHGEAMRKQISRADAAGTGVGLVDLTKMAASGLVKDAQSFIDAFDGTLGRTAAKYGIAKLAQSRSESLSGAFRSGSKITINPNTRSVFESVPIRTFQFTFKMVPQSQREAQEIESIVKFFRTRLYPTVQPIGDVNAIYNFPDPFLIQMLYYDSKTESWHTVAHKLLPSNLTNVSTVYNGGSMAIRPDGSFVEVDLTLDFQEIHALHRRRIESTGNDGGY